MFVSLRVVSGIVVALALVVPSAWALGASVGVAGGITMSEINASGAEPLNVAFTDKVEPVGGIVLVFPIADSFSIQPEALLSIKGSRLALEGRQTDIRLSYIEVPVLFCYSPSDDSPARWLRLLAGPYAAHLIKATSNSRQAGRSPDLEQAFNSFDFGWVVGLGIGLGHTRLDLRYSGGLSDIGAGAGLGGLVPLPPSGDLKYRNRGFALVAAYVF